MFNTPLEQDGRKINTASVCKGSLPEKNEREKKGPTLGRSNQGRLSAEVTLEP